MEDELRYHWLNTVTELEYIERRKLSECKKACELIFETHNPVNIREILSTFGIQISDAAIYALCDERLKYKAQEDTEVLFQKKNIKICHDNNILFSNNLNNMYEAPHLLYYIGERKIECSINVAVTGTRSCTSYGAYYAKEFSRVMASAGICIVTGLSQGIEAFAVEEALKNNANIVAVMPSGCDICYPAVNKRLYDMICYSGVVISEYPPGTKPRGDRFPRRNRIIAAISDGVLICEAPYRSGSLLTATEASNLGRDVFAIPGRINDRCSEGCNDFIKAGAIPVTNPREVVDYYS